MNKHELDCVLKVHALSKSLTDEERKEAYFVLYFGKWPRVLGVPPDSWKRLKPFRFLWYGGRDETAETLRHILSEGDYVYAVCGADDAMREVRKWSFGMPKK